MTPVLMGLSMFAMQKMTPSAMDPAQQRIMLMMPLMLTFMFLWAPAGLNLYWLTSNVWSMAQQWVEMNVLAGGRRTQGEAQQVRDRVFTGGDVGEALAAAAQTLGLPQRELRYVVLDEGERRRPRPDADAGPHRRDAAGRRPSPRAGFVRVYGAAEAAVAQRAAGD